MKTKISKILLIVGMLLSGCSHAESTIEKLENFKSDKKILIVYLSRTGNTKAVAEMIQEKVGGKLIALELQHPYPENYQEIVQQVQRENESGYLPPIKTAIDRMDSYDVVFVGFPTWGMRVPPPIKSFLTQYDLSEKMVIPFNTNAGYGLVSSLETLGELCPNSEIKEVFSVRGGIERDGILFVMEGEKAVQVNDELTDWLQKIGILKI